MEETEKRMERPKREYLFSLTAEDFEWDFIRGSGKGGQKKNKTSSAVRCRHIPSGALGYAEDGRSQSQNRRTAFRRCAESKEFQKWIRIEIARFTGEILKIEERIDKELKDPKTTKVEIVKDGKWEKEQV
jgi:protein subunit release factor B